MHAYICLEEIQNCNYLYYQKVLERATGDFFDFVPFNDLLLIYKPSNFRFTVLRTALKKIGDANFALFKKNPQLFLDNFAILRKKTKAFKQYCDALRKQDPAKKTNQDILELYKHIAFTAGELHARRGIISLMEMDPHRITRFLTRELKAHTDAPQHAFATLTTSSEKTFSHHEATERKRLAKLLAEGKITYDDPLVDAYHYAYCSLPHGPTGPAWTRKEMVKRLQQAVDAKWYLKKETAVEDAETYAKRLKLPSRLQTYLKILREFVFLKSQSQFVQFYSYFVLNGFLQELGKRFSLNPVLFTMMTWQEVEEGITKNTFDKENLEERLTGFSLLSFRDGHTTVYQGRSAEEFMQNKQIIYSEAESETVKGNCAYPGKARATVRIIDSPEDMRKMQQGDILVSKVTTPNIMAAIQKAAAIVTDMGGITCHAAIVSRELKTPCVIGTGNATTLLKDDEVVVVDADNGIVEKI